MHLNVKRPLPTHKGKQIPELQMYGRVEGVGRLATFSNRSEFCPFGVTTRAAEGSFLSPPPSTFLQMLKISPSLSLQTEAFIAVKCKWSWDARQALVTLQFPRGVAGLAVQKG